MEDIEQDIKNMFNEFSTTKKPLIQTFKVGENVKHDEPIDLIQSSDNKTWASANDIQERNGKGSSNIPMSQSLASTSYQPRHYANPKTPSQKVLIALNKACKIISQFTDKQLSILRSIILFYFLRISSDFRQEILHDLGQHNLDHNNPDKILDMISNSVNCNRKNSVLILFELLGLKPKNIFNCFPPSVASQNCCISKRRFCKIPRELLIGAIIYILVHKEPQKSFDGNIMQVICHYNNEDDDIILLATPSLDINDDTIILGGGQGYGLCLSRIEMDKNPNAHVIFCMDLGIAFAFIKLARESKLLDRENIIISGCFIGEGNLNCVDLNDLHGHSVTIIPPFSRDAFLKVKDYVTLLKKAGVENISIFQNAIFKNIKEQERALDIQGSPWKISLVEKAIVLDNVEVLSSSVRKIKSQALSLLEFEYLLSEIGINPILDVKKQASIIKLNVKSFGELSENSVDFSSPPKISDIIRAGFILFIWGASNCGKTFVLDTFISAIASATSAFCLEADIITKKVLKIDGELTEGQEKSRISQTTATNPNKHKVNENIHIIFARTDPIDLLCPEFQKALIDTIKDKNIEVVAFDNLITLLPKSTQGADTEFFNFIYELEKHNVAVIFVNHANKDKNVFKGSSNLESKSQTIIHVEGRDTLSDGNESDALKQALTHNGAVVRLNYTKCKLPPTLSGTHETYHLPVGGVWEYIEGTSPKLENGLVSQDNVSAEPFPDDSTIGDSPILSDCSDLTKDEKLVFSKYANNKILSRQDIQDCTGFKEDKAGLIIKNLKGKKLIIAVGSGNNIKYKLA